MTKNYTKLVEQALKGNKESLRKLAEAIHDPLRSYVFRITLKENLTDDIVQETILEMFKIFGQLNNADRFWPWLCKIAFNKVRSHSRSQNRQKRLLREHAEELTTRPANLDGLATVINEEVREAIFLAMSNLTDEQKAVLSMRCYESMPYSQIAEVMGFTELQSRLLFLRGKKKLQKTLFRFGFSKKALLPALLIFGKFTAPTEAAAAHISITSATLSVGGLAAVIGTATTKTALTIAAGTAITAGTILVANQPLSHSPSTIDNRLAPSMIADIHTNQDTADILEGYYYYPNGSKGPMMTRLTLSQPEDQRPCKILQNQLGNFFMSGRTGQVKQNNYHYWNKDLSVMILPTDDPEFLSFLSQVEGRTRLIQTLKTATNRSLLVVASKQDQADQMSVAVQDYDALMEERFQYNWPADTHIQDNRDPIHRQGWCYVKMTGSVNGQRVDGEGQIPFIYSVSQYRPAWFKMAIGQNVFIDTPSGAVYMNEFDQRQSAYKSGTFLNALNQPWMGLHCIDTIRREAARKRLRFETVYDADPSKCTVRLFHESGSLTYLIDMNRDLIEMISFYDLNDNTVGQIRFEYLGADQVDESGFSVPNIRKYPAEDIFTDHWLVEVMSNRMIGDE